MKVFVIVIFMILLYISCYAQKWQTLNEGSFNAFDVIDENTMFLYSVDYLWGGGIDNSVWKTYDGGETWSEIRFEEGWFYDDLDFYSDSLGWIHSYKSGLTNSRLLKTIDGGATWTENLLDEVWQYSDFNFYNDSIGWVNAWILGYEGSVRILKTSDGGESWIESYQTPDSLYFGNRIIVNDSIVFITLKVDSFLVNKFYLVRTLNGGQTWSNPINIPIGSIEYYYFFDDSNGFIIGNDDWWGRGNQKIIRTQDAGENWEVQTLADNLSIGEIQVLNDSTIYFTATTIAEEDVFCSTNDKFKSYNIKCQIWWAGINSFHAQDEFNIFAIMTDDSSTFISKSIDGGLSWQRKQDILGGDIYVFDNNTGFVFSDGLLYKSSDDGEHWKIIRLGYPFQQTTFIDENKGFLIGNISYNILRKSGYSFFNEGNLYFTGDGGRTWLHNFNSLPLASICFLNDNDGFLLENRYGKGAAIYKTTDGGNNWIECYANNPDSTFFVRRLWEISILNISTILTIGYGAFSDTNGALILSSTSGGENWKVVWSYPDDDNYSYSLNSIYAINETAWIVGEGGLIVKTIAPDSFRLMNSPTDLSLIDVFFSDESHGWISGENCSFFKTINGGMDWNTTPVFNYQINDMFFSDNLHGWAVGYDTSNGLGLIMETIDAGDTWIPVVDNLSGPLNSLYFKKDIGWAVGVNGLILRTDNWTTWVNQNTGEIYPSKFQLSQNYPNPFNPKTIISYQLAMNGDVELSIYNLLGQKVATLVNKKQAAGSYSVEWDANGITSGVYIYKLKAGAFEQSRKMVLLR